MIRRIPFAALALALTTALPASAHIIQYTATLSGAIESPNPVPTGGTGSVLLTVDDHANTMRVQVTFADLSGTVTASHIHCCTAQAGNTDPLPANINSISAGVATPLPTFPGFPSGVTAGSYDQTFQMSQASSYNQNAGGFLQANGNDPLTAFSALMTGLNGGRAYLNLHTSFRGSGEIRGFLSPVVAVPEPETYALMIGGLALVGAAARRARKN